MTSDVDVHNTNPINLTAAEINGIVYAATATSDTATDSQHVLFICRHTARRRSGLVVLRKLKEWSHCTNQTELQWTEST